MDSSMALNLGTMAIAVVSLLISVGMAIRQHRTTMDGYVLPVVLNAFKDTRSTDFFEAQEYIVHRLGGDHDTDRGVRGLPEDVRDQIRTVGLFYDDLAKLVAHGVISEQFVIGSYGANIVGVWEALEPFVYEERNLRTSRFFIYFEDLAARVRRRPPAKVHAELGLRRYRPKTVTPSTESKGQAPPTSVRGGGELAEVEAPTVTN
jgi:hypothetical protein